MFFYLCCFNFKFFSILFDISIFVRVLEWSTVIETGRSVACACHLLNLTPQRACHCVRQDMISLCSTGFDTNTYSCYVNGVGIGVRPDWNGAWMHNTFILSNTLKTRICTPLAANIKSSSHHYKYIYIYICIYIYIVFILWSSSWLVSILHTVTYSCPALSVRV